MLEFGFLVFGCGFFLYVIKITREDEDTRYHRKLNEQREFGYQATSNPPSTKEPQHKK